MIKTGVTLTVYASKAELGNAKDGLSTLIASKTKTKEAEYQLNVSLDACDILDDEVSVNLSVIRANLEDMGQEIGSAMAAEIQKVFNQLE
ncbi:hypothetical protein [Paenibacillus sp. P13VS]|uniref:hypothetical protein n=1 Tax=Paenibacillus sp. P13VS TaxID=2697367 RepID=UPI00187B36EB|nr:hypothetical protein [Paenibacillus sp. P13VS]MBE7682037.1 hypothetical protein [Paenibacillus sp. P13VS]